MSQQPTPRVFVSAPSSDLRSARKVINDALAGIECLPVEESIFGTDYGPVSEVLKRKIASCNAVIHVLGRDYGGEPTYREGELSANRRSWSQIEYDIAKQLNKKLYVFVCDKTFPFDTTTEVESGEKSKLVASHHQTVLADRYLWHAVSDLNDLRQKVERLKLPLDEIRTQLTDVGSDVKATGRRLQGGLMAVIAMVLLAIGTGIYLSQVQRTDVRKGIDLLQTQLESVAREIRLLPEETTASTLRDLTKELQTSGLSELTTKMEQLVQQLTIQTGQNAPNKEDELRIRRASAIIQYSKALELLEQGNAEDAERKYGQAIDNYSTLVNKDSRADLEDILARSLHNRGAVRRQSVATQQQGDDDLKAAQEIFEKLVKNDERRPIDPTLDNPVSGITTEASGICAVVVSQLAGEPALTQVLICKAGTNNVVQSIKKLGAPLLIEPGKYDVAADHKDGQVMLVENLELKEGERKLINPDALLGRLVLKPLTLPGFPNLQDAYLVKANTKMSFAT